MYESDLPISEPDQEICDSAPGQSSGCKQQQTRRGGVVWWGALTARVGGLSHRQHSMLISYTVDGTNVTSFNLHWNFIPTVVNEVLRIHVVGLKLYLELSIVHK